MGSSVDNFTDREGYKSRCLAPMHLAGLSRRLLSMTHLESMERRDSATVVMSTGHADGPPGSAHLVARQTDAQLVQCRLQARG